MLEKIKCNQCNRYTNHEKLYTYEQDLSEADVFYKRIYSLFRCCGCDDVKMQKIVRSSEDYCMDENGGTVIRPETYIYPPTTFRQKPQWFSIPHPNKPITEELRELLDEIYTSMEYGCNRLAVMGIRALIESIMIDKVEDQGSFKKNMEKFQEEGNLASIQKNLLERVLDAGHATVHRSYRLDKKLVISAITIAEHIIESIYILKINENNLLDIPSRDTTKKKTNSKGSVNK